MLVIFIILYIQTTVKDLTFYCIHCTLYSIFMYVQYCMYKVKVVYSIANFNYNTLN